MTQPTVSKHWRRVVSHPDRPQSNHAHLTVLQYYNMHADITQENNLQSTVTIEHLWVSNSHVTGDVTWSWKVMVVAQIYLDANTSRSVSYSVGQTLCSSNIILLISNLCLKSAAVIDSGDHLFQAALRLRCRAPRNTAARALINWKPAMIAQTVTTITRTIQAVAVSKRYYISTVMGMILTVLLSVRPSVCHVV